MSAQPAEIEIVVDPAGHRVDWRELWAYRELFYFLAWRDVKVRYKQTVVGAGWAVFQPLATMVVFTVFFHQVGGISSDGVPYAIFSFTGLLFWNYFSQALTRASESLVLGQGLITKVYFPRIIAPAAATIVSAVDFAVSLLVFVVLMAYYRIAPAWTGVVLLLPMLLLSFVAAYGLGMLLATANARYRDIRYVLPFCIQLLLFLTPVIYPVSKVPHRFQWILYVNPVTGVVTTMRAGLLHEGAIHWGLLGISTLSAFVMLVIGYAYFVREDAHVVDVI